jgi:hypothetical protein
MMVVLYTAQDGRHVVITPAPGVTPEQAASAVPAGLSWQVVDSADVPVVTEPAPFPLLDGFQFRAMLSGLGVLAQAEAIATQAGGLTLLAWQHGAVFNRASPTIATLAPLVGLNDPAVIDAAWRQAATIRV